MSEVLPFIKIGVTGKMLQLQYMNDILRHLTQKKLAAVYRLGDRCHKDAQKRQPLLAQLASIIAVMVFTSATQSTQSTQLTELVLCKQMTIQSFISE
ncbi:predicted protein [Histoplasma mississippiense (nom. inval.)]|uniref:predicted protein n=1 Tax=Ajellomyces capsulatus (strain NAm1 / WU24) TaxID=2059318 RepID=UPI000157D503|nr:predicted protein [Histoplasma mississippiense (nom. inval.)]EDN05395.1 predicted protein [Histoplasma mississippiense (nom. inval.)]